MIKEGMKAPAFRLRAHNGETVSLTNHKGKTIVLYFYPKDNTPGCTMEARDFNAAHSEFKRRNVVVLGVSKDTIESHEKFASKCSLKFPLLSDPEGDVIEKYGAWGEKNMYGRKMVGIIRTTVVIGPDGKIVKLFPKVRVKGHVDKILEVVKEAS